jgi:hypothetical protein
MSISAGAKYAEAPGPAAGYIYQLRYVLFRAMRKLARDPTASIGIERLDDVIIEAEGTIATLEQLKHTTSDEKKYTDSSPEVWRAIGNWARLYKDKIIDLSKVELAFVTNAAVAEHTAISKLGLSEEDRDIDAALLELKSVAAKSQNASSASDRAKFIALDDVVKSALLRAIRFVGDNPNLASLGQEIEELLHFACDASCLTEFRTELEGWWLDRVAFILNKGQGDVVPLIDIDARIGYLREKFKQSSLQIDVEEPADHPADLGDYTFVRQVRVLKVGPPRIRNAQRDFLKASAQRSKWLRESRIDPAELTKYDAELEERYVTQSAIFRDELSAAANDDEKCQNGRQLLGWAETQQVPLRGASAQFLTSGSYHTLADQIRLGWHPEFSKLFGSK